jgi:hypothetical protein
MDFFLILPLGLGVGALLLGIAARRRAERSFLRSDRSRAPAVEAREAPAIAAPASSEPSSSESPTSEPSISEPSVGAPEVPQQPPANRRKYPRIRSDQTFVVTPFAGRSVMAQCCDVSTGGMRFGVVGCTLRAGDLVRVTFNIGAETVAAIGSVVRVQELDPITSDVSLEFVRLDPWASQLLEQALEAEG